MARSLLLPQIFVILIIFASSTVSSLIHSKNSGIRISLKHIDSQETSLSKLEIIQRGLKRSKKRVEKLSRFGKTSSSSEIQAQIQMGEGEYLMNLSIGTPPLNYMAIMDSGSDLIWTQCQPCTNCFNQSFPLFAPKNSSSFSNISCSSEFCKALSSSRCESDVCEYLYGYGDDSSTEGYMGSETLAFGASMVSVPNVAFGCGVNNQGEGLDQGAGIVGLGRGPLSLVSQLGMTKFSYCLTTIGGDGNKTSSLLFGSLADLNFSGINGSPLIKNSQRPSFYYLSLEGITVGQKLLPIPKSVFDVKEDGDGGMIVDSGTTITYLPEGAFDAVKREFVSQMKLRVSDSEDSGLDLCFDLPKGDGTAEMEVPKLVFHFKGLDMELPRENYMVADLGSRVTCLAMSASRGVAIFGNFQQQNMLVVHDLEKEIVAFVPAECDQM